ncbi:hypothetical protein Scep_008594 [Stephania cephalantha]|uniref:Uncharacterized protein n=1 Tax=Stephania cephalantha TaxID=152367 RepID=A0AAP0KEL7_9MAGN
MVWVANRNNLVNESSSGVVKIDGEVILLSSMEMHQTRFGRLTFQSKLLKKPVLSGIGTFSGSNIVSVLFHNGIDDRGCSGSRTGPRVWPSASSLSRRSMAATAAQRAYTP